jgi:hypothetical protein
VISRRYSVKNVRLRFRDYLTGKRRRSNVILKYGVKVEQENSETVKS